MEFKRHQDIVAFKSSTGAPIGFHARNLQVARLSDEIWSSFSAHPEIHEWQNSTSGDGLSDTGKRGAVSNIYSPESEVRQPGSASRLQSLGPRSLTLNVTQICNLHCQYCAAGGDGSYGDAVARISLEKALPQIAVMMRKVPKGESFSLIFLGGEPLLYAKGVEAIGDYAQTLARELGIKVNFTIVTNGTLLTDENVEILKKLKCYVTISIDGAPDVNDLRRPTKTGESSTSLTIAGLNKLIQNRESLGTIGLSSVFDSNHLDVMSTYLYFSEFKIDWMDFTFSITDFSNPSATVEANDRFVSEMQKVAALAYAKGAENELRRIKTFNHYFQQLDEQIAIQNHCGAGKTHFAMDSRGELYNCPWEVGQSSVIQTQKMAETLGADLVELNGCQPCWARNMCGGGCMFNNKQANNDHHLKEKNFCHRTKSLIATAIMYYERSRYEEL